MKSFLFLLFAHRISISSLAFCPLGYYFYSCFLPPGICIYMYFLTFCPLGYYFYSCFLPPLDMYFLSCFLLSVNMYFIFCFLPLVLLFASWDMYFFSCFLPHGICISFSSFLPPGICISFLHFCPLGYVFLQQFYSCFPLHRKFAMDLTSVYKYIQIFIIGYPSM